MSVTSHTGDITVKEGNSVELHCVTSEAFPAANVTWYKDNASPGDTADDSAIPETESTQMIRDSNGMKVTTSNLTYQAQRRDNGMRIYCKASNIDGNGVFSRRKPMFDVKCMDLLNHLFILSNILIT